MVDYQLLHSIYSADKPLLQPKPLIHLVLLLQLLQQTQVLVRMDAGVDHLAEGSNLRSSDGRTSEEIVRIRMHFVQVLDDRHRFDDRRAVGQNKSWNSLHLHSSYHVGVDFLIGFVSLLAFKQMNIEVLRLDAFEVQRNSCAPSGGTPRECV